MHKTLHILLENSQKFSWTDSPVLDPTLVRRGHLCLHYNPRLFGLLALCIHINDPRCFTSPADDGRTEGKKAFILIECDGRPAIRAPASVRSYESCAGEGRVRVLNRRESTADRPYRSNGDFDRAVYFFSVRIPCERAGGRPAGSARCQSWSIPTIIRNFGCRNVLGAESGVWRETEELWN